jgi:hypothetical protein
LPGCQLARNRARKDVVGLGGLGKQRGNGEQIAFRGERHAGRRTGRERRHRVLVGDEEAAEFDRRRPAVRPHPRGRPGTEAERVPRHRFLRSHHDQGLRSFGRAVGTHDRPQRGEGVKRVA